MSHDLEKESGTSVDNNIIKNSYQVCLTLICELFLFCTRICERELDLYFDTIFLYVVFFIHFITRREKRKQKKRQDREREVSEALVGR